MSGETQGHRNRIQISEKMKKPSGRTLRWLLASNAKTVEEKKANKRIKKKVSRKHCETKTKSENSLGNM